MNRWLEVSLTVEQELAEAVAEVLGRFAPNGVLLEQGVTYRDDEDPGEAAGPVDVRAYLPVDAGLEEKRAQLEEALYFLGMVRRLPVPGYREIEDTNWMQAWRERYRPIEVGRRLLIVPAWMEVHRTDRVAVRIEPGMAFGTGTHPSTQLCLELLEATLQEGSRPSRKAEIIDVGCGSGILSIAALKLGAAHALGVDTHLESLENARLNADLNGVASRLTLGHGSLAEVLAGEFGATSAPLVTVNILAPVLVRMLDEGLARLVESDGVLVLGGILDAQEPSVEQAATRAGLVVTSRRVSGDWVSLLLGR